MGGTVGTEGVLPFSNSHGGPRLAPSPQLCDDSALHVRRSLPPSTGAKPDTWQRKRCSGAAPKQPR